MIFPIVAPTSPQRLRFLLTWIYTMSGSFRANWSFSSFVILRQIFSNDLILFLHFGDDLPFDEDLAL
jgi:hypothetical protein